VALKVFKAMRYAGQARNPTLPMAMLAGLQRVAGIAATLRGRCCSQRCRGALQQHRSAHFQKPSAARL
jgi:hypothetical protein